MVSAHRGDGHFVLNILLAAVTKRLIRLCLLLFFCFVFLHLHGTLQNKGNSELRKNMPILGFMSRTVSDRVI